jgi:hypothetical protein
MRGAIPIGIKLLVVFFGFGVVMCALTTALLLFPGTRLDSVWRFNPLAQQQLTGMGGWAVLLMLTVGTACALAAIGLARAARWGRMVAIGLLAINLIGDITGALWRHDPRTLIGVPIGGAMIFYLARRAKAKSETPNAE